MGAVMSAVVTVRNASAICMNMHSDLLHASEPPCGPAFGQLNLPGCGPEIESMIGGREFVAHFGILLIDSWILISRLRR